MESKSLNELELELNRSKIIDERLSEIQHLVLNLKRSNLLNFEGKINEISQLISDLIIRKDCGPEFQRGNTRSTRIKSFILEFLQNENLNSREIHQKLADRGVVSQFKTPMAFADYGLTRSNLITLKNNGKIEKTSKKRGSDWKIILR